MGKQSTKRDSCAQHGGHNVTPALAEYGIAKKLMEGKDIKREVVEGGPCELTALDIVRCALGLMFFLAVCYYGGVQYGR